MANVLYPKGKEALLTAGVNWTSDNIKVVLVDTGAYTYSAAHQFLSDVPSGARVATSAALTGKTATNGVADAADVAITGVTGATVEALVVYKDTGVVGTSPLIAYIDTGVGLPLTPDGGTVTVEWASGAARIFAL